MKILAVIPARAGSKGIPNKNIRIIGGHPLIYYSIKNALNSEFVTDVIVTMVLRKCAEIVGIGRRIIRMDINGASSYRGLS